MKGFDIIMKKLGKKKIIGALGTFMGATSVMPASAMDVNQVSKLAGHDRVDTAKKTANLVNSKILILANGYSFADSLSAQNAANKTGGKVQLVDKNTDVYSMYKNQGIEKIYVIGGMVSKSVIDSAKKLTKNLKVLEGDTRYDTNSKTLKEFGFKSVGVADGRNFPDALSAAPLLKKKGLGLKLVDGSKNYKAIEKVAYTFGEKDSVKQDGGVRIAGRDRYETGNKINNEIGKTNTVAFVNGQNFPDALSAVNVTTATGASIVLVGKNGNAGAKDYVKNANKGYIVGDEVSTSVVNALIKDSTGSLSGVGTNDKLNDKNESGSQSGGNSSGSGGSVTPKPEPKPEPKPDPKPQPNKVNVSIYNAVTNDKVGSVSVDKGSNYEQATVPSGYKVLPNQKINKNDSVFRLYVVPISYTIVTSMEELDSVAAKAVINQMEEKKDIIFTIKSEDVGRLNISQDNYSGIKPDKTNAYLWAMGFSTELTPKGEYIEDNGIFMKSGNIGYKITQAYWTGETFDREKHIQYINKGVEILRSIGVYGNTQMSDMEKAKKISQWIWDNSIYSPVLDNQGSSQEISRKNRSPYSILEFGQGVCEGYSFTTSFLFNIAGIRVNTMESTMHKWNNFYADGNWHKLDNTEPEQQSLKLTWERAYEGISSDSTTKGYDNNAVMKAYDFMQSNGYTNLK